LTVKGIHFIEEDSPHEIGRALAGCYKLNLRIDPRGTPKILEKVR
jgi:hypothetical protein